MINLTNSKKAVIVKVDTGSYHSFNAYVRPKRVNSDYRRHSNARVINLDPTNNPDEVCNAYRDIQIEAQLKRIAKNEKRLAERRRIAEFAAADAKIRAEQAATQKAYRENSALAKRRNAILARMNDGEFLLAPESGSLRSAASHDVAFIRYDRKVSLVSVTSVNVSYEATGAPLSLWGIDKFKRLPKHPYSEKPITSRNELMRIMLDMLNQGYFVQVEDINAAITSIRGAVSALRKEGVVVCTVRNPDMDVQALGWIIPSALNGFTKNKFFTMADVQKA